MGVLTACAAALDPLEDPLEHPAVLAVAGPEPVAVLALRNQLTKKMRGSLAASVRSAIDSQWAK